MRRRVIFDPDAQADLFELYRYIAERSGSATALAYVERIERYCRSFADFPERGSRRDDIWPGLRIVGFERRVTIAFHVTVGLVKIDRVLYGGRDLRVLSRD